MSENTIKILELPKAQYKYTLSLSDDLFKIENKMVVHLNLKGEEIYKYPFKYNEFILNIDSSDSFIFIESKMLSLNGLSMLTIYKKQTTQPHSVHCNFKISYKEKYIYLYSDHHRYVLNKDTIEIFTEVKDKCDVNVYAQSHDDGLTIAQSHDDKVVLSCIDSELKIYKLIIEEEEIFEGGIMPYIVEREHGIFYQNEEFEWYYNNVHLKNIKGNYPAFGNNYILDYEDNNSIVNLYKMI